METGPAVDRGDLKFFGAVGASISHEMKNVLAIINEMMGLLDDLSRPAAGRSLDPARLQQIAGRMRTQIERGNGIMRNLNRFAHSVDQDLATFDLAEMAAFVAALARRRAAMRNVELLAEPAAEPLTVTADAFGVAHLIWECIQVCAVQTAPRATLSMAVHSDGDEAVLSFKPQAVAADAEPPLRLEAAAAAASKVGARLSSGPSAGELLLKMTVNRLGG